MTTYAPKLKAHVPPSTERYFTKVLERRLDHLGARVASRPEFKPNWDACEYRALQWALGKIRGDAASGVSEVVCRNAP